MKGKLYVIATPIGNLEDITFRALKTLGEVDIIAAEDTRQTLKLLNHYNISKYLVSYHRHNEDIKTNYLIDKLKEGKNIGLVSDAGTPGISDPGEEVIKKAIEEEIEVIPIPGACAMINALVCSGLSSKEFIFLGFLPLNKKLRKQKLEEIENATKTVILYEAPHKMKNTLQDLKKFIGNRKICLCRELTKIHEEFIREPIDKIIENIDNLKGEMILVIEANEMQKEEKLELSIEEEYAIYEKEGLNKNEIIKKIAKNRKTNKNEIYQMFIEKK